MTDKECEMLGKIQDDPEKRLNDDELDLLTDLKHEGMKIDEILEMIFEKRGTDKLSWEKVNLKNYYLSIDLHKSMFLIDMLRSYYEFTIKGDEVVIFKKLSNCISEEVTRKEIIYFIQVEMIQKVDYHWKLIKTFYELFNSVDTINKAIDNIMYLQKYLNKKQLSNAIDSIDKAIDNIIHLEKSLNQKEEIDEVPTIKEPTVKEPTVKEPTVEEPTVEKENETIAPTNKVVMQENKTSSDAGPALWAKHSSKKKKISCKKTKKS